MISFSYDFISGYWHGYQGNQIYSIHPTDWPRIPHMDKWPVKLIAPDEVKNRCVTKGHVIVPIDSHRNS